MKTTLKGLRVSEIDNSFGRFIFAIMVFLVLGSVFLYRGVFADSSLQEGAKREGKVVWYTVS